jgi:thiol-disulfide isomerase/thioredoxin
MGATESRSSLWLFGLVGLLTVAAGVLGWQLAGVTADDSLEAGASRPPEVRLTALGGGTVGFADYEGEIVVVDFWASWCAPCRLQAKILDALHEELDGRVQFLAVNLGEDVETVERYVANNGFPYPVLMDPQERLGVGLEIYALPTVMVLDRAGRIAYIRPGISDRPALTDALIAAGVTGIDERST